MDTWLLDMSTNSMSSGDCAYRLINIIGTAVTNDNLAEGGWPNGHVFIWSWVVWVSVSKLGECFYHKWHHPYMPRHVCTLLSRQTRYDNRPKFSLDVRTGLVVPGTDMRHDQTVRMCSILVLSVDRHSLAVVELWALVVLGLQNAVRLTELWTEEPEKVCTIVVKL